jgi:hypothetical protein
MNIGRATAVVGDTQESFDATSSIFTASNKFGQNDCIVGETWRN